MLDVSPDVVLHNVLRFFDRDEIRICRQVNRRLRSYIDCHRTLYPMHPASVRIHAKDFDRRIFTVKLRSDWTNKLISRNFRILSDSYETDRKGNYSGLVEAFFKEEEPDAHIDVSFGVPFFRELVSGILDRYNISNLELKSAHMEMLGGVSQALYRRGPCQSVPYVHIFLAEYVSPIIPSSVFYFCTPTRLNLCNFPTQEVKDYLADTTIQNVEDLQMKFDGDDVIEDFPPEVFLDVKCERLFINLPVSMNPVVLNGILKQWCKGERNFAKKDAWTLITKYETVVGLLDTIFQGVPVEMCEVDEEEMREPFIYFKITRCDSESITVRFEHGNGMEVLINHPLF